MVTILTVLALAMLLALWAFTSTSATPTGTGQTLEQAGASGPVPELHVAAFLTTGATLSLKTQLKTLVGWNITAQGSPGVTELLSLDETVTDFGQVTVSNGAVSIRRAATTTSGLIVSVTLWGY